MITSTKAARSVLTCAILGLANLASAEAPDLPQVPANAPRATLQVEYRIDPATLPAGTQCRIELRAIESGTWVKSISTTTYEGRIARSTADEIILTATQIEQRVAQGGPLCDYFPPLVRLYKNTGVGYAPLDEGKEIHIPVRKIRAVELVVPPLSGR